MIHVKETVTEPISNHVREKEPQERQGATITVSNHAEIVD